MPTEEQELQLRVILQDEASAALGRMTDSVKELSELSERQHERLKHEQEELAKQVKEMGELVVGGREAMFGYIGKIGAAGAAMAGLGTALFVGLGSLKEFADRVNSLSIKAKVMGMDPAELKSIIQQYERAGVAASTVEQSLAGFSETLANINRAGSSKREEMVQAAGAYADVMMDSIAKVEAQTNDSAKLQEILIQAENVYRNRLAQTNGNAKDANEAENHFLRLWNLDPSLKALRRIDQVDDAMRAKFAAQQKATEVFRTTLYDVNSEIGELFDDFKTSFLDANGVVVSGLKLILAGVKEIREIWEQPWLSKGLEAIIRHIPGVGLLAGAGDLIKWGASKLPKEGEGEEKERSNEAITGGKHENAPTPPAEPHPAAPLGFAGGPFGQYQGTDQIPGISKGWEWMRRSENIEDRRGENFDEGLRQGDDYLKSLDMNTTEMKKLNNNFIALDKGEVRLKGLGGLPGFGGRTGGGATPYGVAGPTGGGGATTGGAAAVEAESGGAKQVSSPTGGDVAEKAASTEAPSSAAKASTDTATATPSTTDKKEEKAAPTDSKGNKIDSEVFKQAEAIAANPNKSREQREQDAKRFIESHGGHVDSAWCGDFVGAVQRSQGQKLPAGYQVATSWANYGTAVKPGEEQPGDIAIMMRGHRAGETGGHVMMVGSEGRRKDGRVQTFGANIAREGYMNEQGLVFRRPPPLDKNKTASAVNADRSAVDAASTDKKVRTVKVDINGSLKADVKGPAGTKVSVEGDGAFKKTETNRTVTAN